MPITFDDLSDVEIDVLSAIAGFGMRTAFELRGMGLFGNFVIQERTLNSLRNRGLITRNKPPFDENFILTDFGAEFVLDQGIT